MHDDEAGRYGERHQQAIGAGRRGGQGTRPLRRRRRTVSAGRRRRRQRPDESLGVPVHADRPGPQDGPRSIHTFSLAEARERARHARQQLADGIDPIEARLAERDARREDEAERITFKAPRRNTSPCMRPAGATTSTASNGAHVAAYAFRRSARGRSRRSTPRWSTPCWRRYGRRHRRPRAVSVSASSASSNG